MSASVTRCPPETSPDPTLASRKDRAVATKGKTKPSTGGAAKPTALTLADVLISLGEETSLSDTRRFAIGGEAGRRAAGPRA
jgi:hypothetical protein